MFALAGHDRTYSVPKRLNATEALAASGTSVSTRVLLASGQVTAWDLLELSQSSGALGLWASGTLNNLVSRADTETLAALDCLDCEDHGYYGIAASVNPDKLTMLVRETPGGSYERLTSAGWSQYLPKKDQPAEMLSLSLAADLGAVLASGGDGLMLRYTQPVAWLPPNHGLTLVPLTAAAQDAEEGWKPFAIVDDLDTGAVLNLIRLAKGPRLEAYTQEDKWAEDKALLTDLTGVSPPKLVELDDALLASVISQIDSTENPDQGFDDAVAESDQPVTASTLDPRAERLRRYWSIGGKGGLKIRWGMPGDWRRCYKHLIKYMGPRAKGYCQNLHKRNTGVYTGSKLNASATWPVVSTEAALAAAISAGAWSTPSREDYEMQDGIYTEVLESEADMLSAITAGAFPVAPPDEWFDNPNLTGPTPLTVTATGQVHGHIATFDMAHIGLPGKVHAPKSKSGYAFFHTGELITASGGSVGVGQLTLAGGHAPLSADAGQAAAHYDNTASAIADVRVGEDKFGIWAAGSLRPEATQEQVRALRASAPSGDWRPINGNLELVAVCQVNVPGFPIARARVASGAVMALVAAGARPLAEARWAAQADESLANRVSTLEAALIAAGVMVGGDEAVEEGAPLEDITEEITAKEEESAKEEDESEPEVDEGETSEEDLEAAEDVVVEDEADEEAVSTEEDAEEAEISKLPDAIESDRFTAIREANERVRSQARMAELRAKVHA